MGSNLFAKPSQYKNQARAAGKVNVAGDGRHGLARAGERVEVYTAVDRSKQEAPNKE